mmetsp:Transcript_32839/g.106163  ORF Transcript_32839/g.106163 Transcript_32839/m.106163 type:complete len:278 (-) Transcript_32839:309-1142(-)
MAASTGKPDAPMVRCPTHASKASPTPSPCNDSSRLAGAGSSSELSLSASSRSRHLPFLRSTPRPSACAAPRGSAIWCEPFGASCQLTFTSCLGRRSRRMSRRACRTGSRAGCALCRHRCRIEAPASMLCCCPLSRTRCCSTCTGWRSGVRPSCAWPTRHVPAAARPARAARRRWPSDSSSRISCRMGCGSPPVRMATAPSLPTWPSSVPDAEAASSTGTVTTPRTGAPASCARIQPAGPIRSRPDRLQAPHFPFWLCWYGRTASPHLSRPPQAWRPA